MMGLLGKELGSINMEKRQVLEERLRRIGSQIILLEKK
jgi:hypothetical protein